jgi:hypothetical protein
MRATKPNVRPWLGVLFWVTVLALLSACAGPAASTPDRPPAVASALPPGIEPSETPIWPALLGRTPFPYTTPLPPPVPGVLDGTYVRTDPRTGTRIPCRRCPPYPPEGGVWKLHLNQGIFRVYHPGTGWYSLGSYTAKGAVGAGTELALFNDPHCYADTGIYQARLVASQLILEVVSDGCGSGLRAQSLAGQAWESCQPPTTESAVTDHWPVPVGCGMGD